MRRLLLPIATLALLTACSSEPDADAPLATESPVPAAGDDSDSESAGPLPDPAADLSQLPLDANLIPIRFRGVWDYEGGTCSEDSDMRMEVSGDEILFYESIGKVLAVEADGDDIVVRMAMEGEGEEWRQATRFALVGEEDDMRLHASDGEEPKVVDEYPSKLCAAGGETA